MSISSQYGEIYASRNTPEARAELEAIQAGVKVKADEALCAELDRYSGSLLPGAAEAIASQFRRSLGATADPVRTAVAVSEFMRGPLAKRFLAPAPEADTLRQVIDRHRGEFKSPAAAEAFYRRHSLELAHKPESDVVAAVARLVRDRSSNEFLKAPVPQCEATNRLVEALRPFDALLAGRLEDVADHPLFADLVGPNAPRDVKHLTAMVEGRLKGTPAARLLRDGAFNPDKVARPRPAVQQQAAPPSAPTPSWEVANAAQFARHGL